jgi:hypothetical protein
MIKIYTDAGFIIPEYRKIIFPLLLDLCFLKNANLLQKYQIVREIEFADIVIVPLQIGYFFKEKRVSWLYDFIDRANNCNKKVWVYAAGDFGATINKDVYTFRLGGFNSKLNNKTIIMPSLIADPYSIINTAFKPIPKNQFPTIGFVGNANGSVFKWFKEFVIYIFHNLKRIKSKVPEDYQSFYPSSIKRYQSLIAFQKNNQIISNFIFRKKYRAGAKTEEEREKSNFEFLNNIYENPYVFCLRGAGNFSVRLYETLAMGRIPVIVDTDIRLPLESIISWDKHCVITNENDFVEKLIDFHNCITDSEFEQIQINNRNLWLNYFNRESYFNSIYTLFKELI